jgi:DNA-binding NarL/FixJ family response regulator
MITVLIVDDEELVRTGLRMILAAEEDISVVGDAGDGREALTLARRLRPDVVLMDIRMPRMDGLEAIRLLCAEQSEIKVMVLTTFDLDEHVFAALSAGANGFLLKDAPASQLLHAIRVVNAGEALLAPSVTRRLISRFAEAQPTAKPDLPADLTSRETEVLTLMAQGLSNSEIATRLFVGDATVKTHVARVLAKLGVRDRVQAVVIAYRSGLVN